MSSYLLAINCGSSSIKGKLYHLPQSQQDPLKLAASLSVSGISSKGEKIKIKVQWDEEEGRDVNEEGEDGGSVEYKSLVPLLLNKLTSAGKVSKDEVKYVVHRVVHGGQRKEGLVITKDHTEGLEEMDKLSDFAPLHNHHAVLAVRSCLDALPNHTSLLVFDTLFHQTIPAATRTYALPPSEFDNPMPLQKYGFHGLSYASIVQSLSRHLKKPADEIDIVVAHLGSGASAACIKGGKSIDTSMGLTPLEGLLGGTRCGTIDPTAVFHLLKDPGADGGADGMKVSKAELTLNKKSGLQALAGTTNFGLITSRIADPSSCSKEEHEAAKLAYDVYLDRLMGYISQYIFKLYSQADTEGKGIDGLVFSGGIGEKSVELRRDVLARLGWLGAHVDNQANEASDGPVRQITTTDSRLEAFVVETDEEGWCANLARQQLKF